MTQEEMMGLDEITKAKCVPISEHLMTPKQKEKRQVSPFDNRSRLAKLRRKTHNNLRNKPCACGSGRKFKKCCWYKMATAVYA